MQNSGPLGRRHVGRLRARRVGGSRARRIGGSRTRRIGGRRRWHVEVTPVTVTVVRTIAERSDGEQLAGLGVDRAADTVATGAGVHCPIWEVGEVHFVIGGVGDGIPAELTAAVGQSPVGRASLVGCGGTSVGGGGTAVGSGVLVRVGCGRGVLVGGGGTAYGWAVRGVRAGCSRGCGYRWSRRRALSPGVPYQAPR